jgi:hypothetical protein
MLCKHYNVSSANCKEKVTFAGLCISGGNYAEISVRKKMQSTGRSRKKPGKIQEKYSNRPVKYIYNDVIVGLAVFHAASPLDVLGVLFLSEVAYCAKAAISSGLSATL